MCVCACVGWLVFICLRADACLACVLFSFVCLVAFPSLRMCVYIYVYISIYICVCACVGVGVGVRAPPASPWARGVRRV